MIAENSHAAPGLELRHIKFRYVDQKRFLFEDLNLCCAAGAISVILGPSGCGKTTLLDIVAGLTRPLAGEVILEGSRTVSPKHVGMIFQSDNCLPWLTVEENVAFGRGRRNREDRLRVLHRVGLTGFEQRYPNQLSAGQRQRVAVARMLFVRDQLILCDEPFSSLDTLARGEMWAILIDAVSQNSATALVVTHEPDEAIKYGRDIILLGQSPTRVLHQFRNTRLDASGEYQAEFADYYVELLRGHYSTPPPGFLSPTSTAVEREGSPVSK